MPGKRLRPPTPLLVAIVVLLIVAAVFYPIISAIMPKEDLDRAILLLAVPFLAVFIAILLTFISFIFVLASALNNKVHPNRYRTIELSIIGGIVLGLVGMFQPFAIELYQLGFLLLLFSTLAFITWSHIIPGQHRRETSKNG
ncbi:MAG: hypothetical protein DWB42_14910 [Chloroflexi bacterium]|jgi:hypothetical protein|nr:hypothetical protein [Chloroflexota bacterium]MDL1883352.1 hypothetical protein [Anaerolineae bacterium CFX8]GIL13071.1 MAG: hypothetical protein BroJett038_17910 [Chloroflexota bacterium]